MTEMVKISSAKGASLFTESGEEILDLISSWWVNIHGHAHPVIAEAISQQAATLEQVIFAGFSHEPAEVLADNLLATMGEPFRHIFYSDNGSTAVEVGIKMALQYFINRGETQRKAIVAFEGGFHGDTWAAMCAGQGSGFFDTYSDFLNLRVIHHPFAATYDGDPNGEENERASIAQFESLMADQGAEIAALIIEPLVQGASGMRICRPEWLEKIVSIAKAHDVQVIFDEVMTGFSRTGKMFAFEHLETRPDIVCLSKGITGGFMPFAATVATADIFDSFLGDTFGQALSHGHSYAGNPIACAAAVASLELFQTEQTLSKVAEQNLVHRECLPELSHTIQHRTLGAIAACELDCDWGYGSPESVQLRTAFMDSGLLVRPLGKTLYLMPPACLDPETLKKAYQRIDATLTKHLGVASC